MRRLMRQGQQWYVRIMVECLIVFCRAETQLAALHTACLLFFKSTLQCMSLSAEAAYIPQHPEVKKTSGSLRSMSLRSSGPLQ
jgi:hypothetical protein